MSECKVKIGDVEISIQDKKLPGKDCSELAKKQAGELAEKLAALKTKEK